MDNIQNTMARPLKDKIRAILSGKPLENETADEKLLRSLYIVPKKNTVKMSAMITNLKKRVLHNKRIYYICRLIGLVINIY